MEESGGGFGDSGRDVEGRDQPVIISQAGQSCLYELVKNSVCCDRENAPWLIRFVKCKRGIHCMTIMPAL